MYPYFSNPMGPIFAGLRKEAANVPEAGEKGTYSADMFMADFSQFYKVDEATGLKVSLVPTDMLNLFIENANASVLPSRWGSMWRYAAGLYTAHFASLYLKTYRESSDSALDASAGAEQMGVIKQTTMGDTSIQYDNSAITAATAEWGAWNSTTYGAQLVTLAKQIGALGMYII